MDPSRPVIGILSAHTERETKHENKRLIEEISELGGDAMIVNYRRCAVGVLETGRTLFQYDDDDVPVPVDLDAVIPRVGRFVESGVWVLAAPDVERHLLDGWSGGCRDREEQDEHAHHSRRAWRPDAVRDHADGQQAQGPDRRPSSSWSGTRRGS